ncbi:hypothetical protein [Paraburkholderia sp. J41]|uniref:hypothetical protein n=1 Tax=Paraburkholderia sp. J41 TaxID=2805433 RepID=UPI002AC36BEF|nr:hypothetical protein [Paraburkholderia sp. J41]
MQVDDQLYSIAVVATERGGWTFQVKRSACAGPADLDDRAARPLAPRAEARFDIAIEFESEGEAWNYSEVVVREMAQRLRHDRC